MPQSSRLAGRHRVAANMGVQDIKIINHPGQPGVPQTILIATGTTTNGKWYSIGILRSTDGGTTWQQVTLNTPPVSSREVFIKLLVDRTNSSVIYAISNQYVYKSVDEGLTWDQKWIYNPYTDQTGQSTFLTDIEQHTVNPDIIYVASKGRIIRCVDPQNPGQYIYPGPNHYPTCNSNPNNGSNNPFATIFISTDGFNSPL